MKLNQTSLDFSRVVPQSSHPASSYTLQDFLDMLEELDSGDFEVSDWEAQFIESNLDARHLTMKQKKTITSMYAKYVKRSKV